jgi:hypothetical protein
MVALLVLVHLLRSVPFLEAKWSRLRCKIVPCFQRQIFWRGVGQWLLIQPSRS